MPRGITCFLLFAISIYFAAGATQDEFNENIWNYATEFILTYHSQWSLRRVVIVYHPFKGKENYMFNLAMDLFQKLSRVGMSSSFIRIPNAKAVEGLRLTEPNQPPVTCILFLTPNDATSGFVRLAAEAGGTSSDSVSWIHLRNAYPQRSLTTDMGLHPDTELITAIVQKAGTANLFRWTGYEHKETTSVWEGPGKAIPAELADKPTINLSGKKLSVAVFDDHPFIFADNLTANMAVSDSMVTGWMIDVWKDLQKILNFTTTYYIPSRVDPQIGLFHRAVEELKSGRADVILSPFVITLTDFDEAEFTASVTDLHYRFLLPRVSATSTIDQFIKPFQLLLWRATALVLTLAVGLITFAYVVGRYYGFEEEGTPIFQIKESIMIIYGSLFAQGPDFAPLGYAGRIILWATFLFGVVVSQAFSAALISKLTVGTLEPPFDSLESMIESSYTALYLPGSAIQKLIQTAEKGAWKELRDRKPHPRVIATPSDAVIEVSNPWTLSTFLGAKERILPLINKPPLNCKTTLVPTNILHAPAQLMVSKSSPYKSAINQELISMQASGRLARIRSAWMGLFFEEPCPKETTLEQFGMANVILPFAVLGGALFVGVLILVVEFLIKKWFGRLLNDKFDEKSELQAIARRQGVRITKGWYLVRQKMPIKEAKEE